MNAEAMLFIKERVYKNLLKVQRKDITQPLYLTLLLFK